MKSLFRAMFGFIALYFSSLCLCPAQQLADNYNPVIKALPVLGVAQAGDGNYLIGGAIDYLGNYLSGSIVKLNPQGQPVAGFNKIVTDGSILHIKPLSDGKFLICGTFKKINGLASGKVAKFNADGSVDTGFTFTSTEDIRTLDVQSTGKIIVIGAFTNFAGKGYNYIIRLHPNGNLDETFGKSTVAFANNLAINASDEILLNRINTLTKLLPDGAIDNTFTSPILSSFPVQMDHIDDLGSEWVVSYSQFNTPPYTCKLVKLENNGAIKSSFAQIQMPQQINRFSILSNGDLVLGGTFSTYNDQPANLVLFKADGTFDRILAILNTNFITDIFADAANGIIITGGFVTVNNQDRVGIARLKPDFSMDADFRPELSQAYTYARAEAQSNGKLIVSGQFEMIGADAIRSHLIRLNADGTADATFDPQINKTQFISALAVQPDNKILVSGIGIIDDFTTGLIRLQPDGQADNSFAIGQGPQIGTDRVLAQIVKHKNSKIYVAGNFTHFNSQPSPHLAILEENGNIAGPSNKILPTNSSIADLEVQSDGKIVLLGFFPFPGSNRRIIRLNADGTLDTTFPVVEMTGAVLRDIEVDYDNRIIVMGLWDAFNGVPVKNIARINTDGTIDASFAFGNGFVQSLLQDIHTIKVLPTNILAVSGSFDAYDGVPSPSLALFDENGEMLNFSADLNTSSIIGRMAYHNNTLFGVGRILYGGGEKVSGAIKITFDIEVGIDDESQEESLVNVYPNPFTDRMQIEFPSERGEADVKVYSSTGSLLLEKHIVNGEVVNLSTGHFAKGFYIVRTELSNGKVKYNRVVKN